MQVSYLLYSSPGSAYRATGTQQAAVVLINALFPIHDGKEKQKQLIFICNGQKYTFIILSYGYVNPLMLRNK